MFYFDEQLRKFETNFQWDSALNYLERLYWDSRSIVVLNSIIGYSWYYLVEGPLVSKKYENDATETALEIWKKYLDIGLQEANTDPFFNFIAGYTLSLHGFLINAEYEKKGAILIKNCLILTCDPMLQELARTFLMNQKGSRYKPLKNGESICKQYFSGNSLLDEYFTEIYSY